MADSTVVSIGSETQKAPPPQAEKPKTPLGRPRKDGLPPGTAVEAVEIPEGDFFMSLTQLEPGDWQYLTIYVYRVKPITDRQSKGEPNYITKYGEAIDIDRLMRDHGSGRYQLRLIEIGNSPKGREVKRCNVDIVNLDYPPKLWEGDWVDDVRNRDWLWCRPRLMKNPTPGQGGTSASEIAEAFMRMQTVMNPPKKQDEGVGILAALAPLLDPQRQTDMMLAFASLLPKPTPPAAPAEDKTLTLLLTMMMDDRKAMREELSEMRRQANNQPQQKDMLDSLLDNKEKFEALKGLFGKGNSGPAAPEGWAGVADKFVDRIGGALQTIAPVIAQRMMMPPPGQPNTQPQQPPRTLIQTTAQPLPPAPAPAEQPVQQQPQQQTPATLQPEAAPVPTTEQQQKAMDIWNKYGNAIMQALPFMIDKFQEEFPDGYDCRDWFCSPKRFGNVMWHGLKTEVGIDGFVQIAKQFPDVWMKFQPEDKFREFMADFFTPLGEERPDDFDDDEEEVQPDAGTK